MKILVSGSSGLIGSALVRHLRGEPVEPNPSGPASTNQEHVRACPESGRHHAIRLVRRQPKAAAAEIAWDPEAGQVTTAEFEGLDAVVHLAGESVADGRWTREKKLRIRNSRVGPTNLLTQTLTQLARPPKVLISASAIGIYGNRGDEQLDEQSPPGEGFLAGVCRDWESATEAAVNAGIRVVNVRFGVVLSKQGGALAPMLPLFRLGLGGRLGGGRQYLSWITLHDAIGAIALLLEHESLHGPVNLVAPGPVTNREFTSTLARALHRPAILPVPALALRAALGEMADEMLLSSACVLPRKLLQSGYQFRDIDLANALRQVLS